MNACRVAVTIDGLPSLTRFDATTNWQVHAIIPFDAARQVRGPCAYPSRQRLRSIAACPRSVHCTVSLEPCVFSLTLLSSGCERNETPVEFAGHTQGTSYSIRAFCRTPQPTLHADIDRLLEEIVATMSTYASPRPRCRSSTRLRPAIGTTCRVRWGRLNCGFGPGGGSRDAIRSPRTQLHGRIGGVPAGAVDSAEPRANSLTTSGRICQRLTPSCRGGSFRQQCWTAGDVATVNYASGTQAMRFSLERPCP